MGSFCSSTPAKSTTNQNQSYSADPRIQQAGSQALGMAENAASQPFQMPAAPVAGFSPFQTQAFNQIQGLQGGTNPYFDAAKANQTNAGTPVNAGDIQQYVNPYGDAALAAMKKYIFDPQRVSTMGSAVQSAGGVGADRLALTSQNLDKTQADAVAQAEAGFYQPAMNMAQQQKIQAQNSAQGWANLGTGYQNANLQATGALSGAGNQQQAQQQAELMSPYQQILARLAYPYQNSQFLAGITGGLAPAFGGNTSGTGTTTSTPGQPSMFNQILGGAGIGLAAYNMYNGGGGGGTQGANGLPTDVAQNGSGIYTGDASYPGFADGGEVEEPAFPGIPSGESGLSPIPYIPLHGGGGQNTGAKLDLNPKVPQQQSGGTGDAMKTAAQMAMMFMERGGSVNPWDVEQSFDVGGDVEEVSPDDFNRIDAASVDYSRPLERPAPNLGMWPFNRGQADYKGDVTMFPDSPPTAPQPSTATMPPLQPSYSPSNMLDTPAPARALPPAIPTPPPQPTAIAAANPPDRTGGYRPRGINSDMNISDFQMPKSQNPYPDALERDWGQKATRSPWMALMAAGAKMAQTVGPPGAAIGAAAEAGMGALSKQRTELRSEQQINQKADELYRHAKSELNKYTRKTPHELATENLHAMQLAKMRYVPTNLEVDDGKGGVKTIAAGYDPQRNQYIDPETNRPIHGKLIAKQSGAESATSRAARSFAAAKDDPNYASDQLGTINKWRLTNGLPPQASFELPKDKSQLVVGHTYPTSRGPATWNGTEFVQ